MAEGLKILTGGAEVAGKSTETRGWSGEAELVERLRAGDESAFRSLVEAYHGRLLRLARGFVADGATAEEVVQETWLAVIQGIGQFEGRSSVKTWLFRILTNRAKTRGVREARSVPFSAFEDEGGDAQPAVDPSRFDPRGRWTAPVARWNDESPEKLALRAEVMGVLEQAMSRLPARQRAVVTLRDVEGLEAEEVCTILEISDANQRVLLHRARATLHRELEHTLGGR